MELPAYVAPKAATPAANTTTSDATVKKVEPVQTTVVQPEATVPATKTDQASTEPEKKDGEVHAEATATDTQKQ